MGFVCFLLTAYLLVVIVRIVLSWFPLDPSGVMASVSHVLIILTEPLLGPLRRAIPPLRFGNVALDLSPIIVLVGLQILAAVIGC